MADVFVSYSRRDTDFVRRLAESVSARGKELWLDTEGIADGEVFPHAIRSAIEQSDAFLFVITPAAVASSFCENEIEYARELQKRIVPVLRERVPDRQLPAEIRDRNWIPFTDGDEFDASLERLVDALDRDLEHAKAHTRWLVKGIEWESERRDKSFLLRGAELKTAEEWLASSPEDADPAPTALQREYLLASREAAARRQRTLVGASLAVAAVAIGLLIFALISRSQAESAQTVASSRALAAESEAQATVNPQLAILLGVQAVKTSPTPQALFALRGALDSSPLRMTLANPPLQCGGPGVAYDPAEPRIAEALCNGELRIFNSASGRLLDQRSVGGFASAPAYSGDGRTLVVGMENGVSVLDGRTLAPRLHLAGGRVNDVAITPDGSLIAASSSTGVGIWSIEQGVAHTIQRQGPSFRIPPGGAPETISVAWLEGGKYLLVGGGGPNGIRVYQLRPKKLVETLPGTGFNVSITTSPDGHMFAVTAASQTASGGTASVWDSHSRKRLFTVATFPGLEITTAAFSPDGTRVALGMADGKAGLWSIATHEQLASYLGPTATVSSLAFGPEGHYVAAASSDGTTNVWRASGPEEAFIKTVGGSAIGGSGPIALGVNRVTVVGASERATLVRSFSYAGTPAGVPLHIPPSPGIGLSEDGSLVAAGGAGPSIFTRAQAGRGPPSFELEIWNLAQRRVIGKVQTTASIGQVQFSRDGRTVALFDSVQPAVAEIATGRRVPLQNAHPCQPGWRWGAFSADGKLVAGADFCGDVMVWDAASGRRIAVFQEGGEISQIAFDPRNDGELAVGSWDSQITIWNVHTARAVRVLTGHTGGVATVAYSPDGALLASGGLDDTARVWDPSSGRLLRVLKHPDPVLDVTFSPDGLTLATNDAQSVVRIWDACTACGNAKALLALARGRVAQQLTPLQRKTFLGGL